MIRELRITNFAIIENISVNFHAGLNVLTGETGAGKSIIIDALNLILGGRADTDCIRSMETSATVEACIEVTDPATRELVHALGYEIEDGELFIKRTLSQTGKNRSFLNNSNITVSALAQVGDRLVDIHGQHDHQSLLRPETHVDLLDRFGNLGAARGHFTECFREYQKTAQELREIHARQSQRLQRLDLLNFQAGEIDQAGLTPGEEEELITERNKLRHAEKLQAALQRALDLLTDAEGSAQELLGSVDRELKSLPEIDPELENPAQRAQSAYYEVQELAGDLRDYARALEFNPSRLEEIEDRLTEINGLKRKYGQDIAAILEYRERIGTELETLTHSESVAENLQEELRQKETATANAAVELAGQRERAAAKLKKSVENELKDLSMKHARFGVRFNYPEDPAGFAQFGGHRVSVHSNGIGEVEFLFSSNPGEELRPLARIASGGELSRVMLALKSILNQEGAVPVMVFDEVDAGIGGRVAEKVGEKLKKIATDRQVFCITHLPQIAGFADAHYRVEKTVAGKRTRSTITELDYEQRVEEIARMSGGKKITEATLKHAREMIK